MRTPWKMLADLVSGKSSKDETETAPQTRADEATPAVPDTISTVKDADAAPALIEDAVAMSSEPVIATQPEAIKKPVMVADAEIATATTAVDRPLAIEEKTDIAVSSATNEKSDDPSAVRRVVKAAAPVKAKRVVATRQKEEIALPAIEPVQVAEPLLKSASEEMADLDREIEELRKQLAEKLKRQNAYLRKLIDRYENR